MYSSRQVAELLDLPVSQVRQYARAGVLAAERDGRGAYAFGFQDLVVLRTAMRLASSEGLSHRRVRRALGCLRLQLDDRRSLTEVGMAAAGDTVVVQDGERVWDPDSGQMHFNFAVDRPDTAVSDLPRETVPARAAAAPPDTPRREVVAQGWYELGRDREGDGPTDAVQAYRRALSAHPDHVDARVSLARLLQQLGHLDEAIGHYRTVLSRAPYHSTAAFNLGVALEDQDKLDQAAIAYRYALKCDPNFPDAHYNIARLYEQFGDRQRALRHYQAYRRLTAAT